MPPVVPGGVFAPTTITFLKMPGTELYGTPISTSPFCPKAETVAPVLRIECDQAASGHEEDAWRRAAFAGPVRDAAPDGAPPVTGDCQISLPVCASSASTRFAAGKYITPSMTIGVAWEFTLRAAAPRPRPAAGALLWSAKRPGRSQIRDVLEM